MGEIMKVLKIILQVCLIALSTHAIFGYTITRTKAEPKLSESYIAIEKTLFDNCRNNPIELLIVDNKNNVHSKIIRIGDTYTFHHKHGSLKKVTIYEQRYDLNIEIGAISQSDLKTYQAFIFNIDGKIEKFNFLDIHYKDKALKKAHDLGNTAAWSEISEQTVYNP